MCAGEHETGHRIVIELGSCPRRCRVALLTRSRETGGDVIGVGGLVEIRLVTTDAGCRCSLVLSVHVTLRAHQRLMSSSQRESGCSVIELRAGPGGGVVALRARGGESGGNVIGVLRVVEVCLVTTDAIRGSALELSIGVALVAGQRQVGARKSEASHRGVVELGAGPCRRAMALLASRGEARSHVIRVHRGVEFLLVTAYAIRRIAMEVPADVACNTFETCVSTGECEACEAVVELRALPRVHGGVALLTSSGEPERPVVG